MITNGQILLAHMVYFGSMLFQGWSTENQSDPLP